MSFCALTSVSAQTATADAPKKKSATPPVVITPEQLQDSLQRLIEQQNSIKASAESHNKATEYIKTFAQKKSDSIFVVNYQKAEETNKNYTAANNLTNEALAKQRVAQSTRQRMEIYAKIKREKIYQDHLQFIYGKFCNLNDETLARLRESIESYKDKSGYKQKVEAVCRNKEIYDRCINALNAPFCKDTIKSVRKKEVPMLNDYNNKSAQNTLSDEQFKELDSLDISLSRYESGTLELVKLIDKVNVDTEVKKLREAKDKAGYVEKVKSIVEENEANKAVYERYFNRLPYLKKLINDYMAEVESDPTLQPTKIEQEIKKLCNTQR